MSKYVRVFIRCVQQRLSYLIALFLRKRFVLIRIHHADGKKRNGPTMPENREIFNILPNTFDNIGSPLSVFSKLIRMPVRVAATNIASA